jgi:hypothetical protein
VSQDDVRPISGAHPCGLCHYDQGHDPGCMAAIPSDLLVRLRNVLDYPTTNVRLSSGGETLKTIHPDLLREAADEIERLRQLDVSADQPNTGEVKPCPRLAYHKYTEYCAVCDNTERVYISAVSGLADALGASTVIPPEDMPRALYEARQEVERLSALYVKDRRAMEAEIERLRAQDARSQARLEAQDRIIDEKVADQARLNIGLLHAQAEVEQLKAILGVLDLTCSNAVWRRAHGTACGICPECVALAALEGGA